MKSQFSFIDPNYVYIFVFSLIFFFPFLGGVHLFDWDEINFAESAREMILTGDYLTVQVNFIPFWEKPPLFIWMQVLSMKVFGINEFAARFPNAVCGIVTLVFLYWAGKRLFSNRFGLLWAGAYAGSVLTFFYFKSGIIDPWFNLFIFAGIYSYYEYTIAENPQKRAFIAIITGSMIGLAILTKGPVALLVFALTQAIHFSLNKFRFNIRLVDLGLFVVFMGLTGGLWFILQIMIGNYGIIADFIQYQIRLFKTRDAGHGGFLLYHFVVVFFGVFPASVLAFSAFRKKSTLFLKEKHLPFQHLMAILLSVVLVLFTIVKTKILHYSSLTYFPLTFFAALAVYKLHLSGQSFNRFSRITISILGVMYGFVVMVLPFIIITLKEWIVGNNLIKDPFAIGNLQAQVTWYGWEGIGGLMLIVGVVLFNRYRKDVLKATTTIFAGTILFISITLVLIIPRVEGYSQRAALEFYKIKAGQDVYVNTLGFKSYAQLFYFEKPVPDNPESYNSEWLLKGNIDKDAYFVSKIQRKQQFLDEFPLLTVVEEKNGFVFFKRFKPTENNDNQ